MADIARMAGVSVSTVSRALSGGASVAAITRIRILQVAEATGYNVNESARNLRHRRTSAVEVIIPAEPETRRVLHDPVIADMLDSIADALSKRHHDLLLSKTPPWSTEIPYNSIISGRADGIILIGQGPWRRDIRDFARQHNAVAVWGGHFPEDDYTVVGSDNVEGGRLATAHLIARGRRRIVFFGDPDHPEEGLRLAGCRQALGEAGLSLPETHVIRTASDGPPSEDTGGQLHAAADQLARGCLTRGHLTRGRAARSGPDFDGVVAASDMAALAVLAALGTAGLSVPDDVAVTGYGDVAAARTAQPPLTTIDQHIREGGRRLVQTVLDMAAGITPSATHHILPPDLIVRQST
ncbi:LacI family DNA-binding transcriptional regulator [Eilatimonas milleporae]|uniref:LacI family transcriptional regulator n=1 Tax=Eilatimonas milleporae TaxID=911205 RepID=A0A3M0CK75_9PROT|nr:LacI family DNA-binding transcriptional regulator [Eilatimonas milleporae]RMB08760.1 LacI family transcriptional regulator [Eilatimonas milleporae]